MNIQEAINHILNGDAILFLGAGFSMEATNIQDSSMANASELSFVLCNELGLPRNDDLATVSDYYLTSAENDTELERRKLALITHIQNLYITKRVKEYHKILVNCPWRRIYTTNYDDVVEFAHADRVDSYSMHTDYRKMIRGKCVVHLNGFCRSVTKEQLNNEFKLTKRSYLEQDFINSNSFKIFNHDIRNSKAIIFVGVSLKSDLDIQRILYMDKSTKDKVIFIDRESNNFNPLEDNIKKNLGSQYKIGVENFGEEIKKVNNSYTPPKKELGWNSFENYNISYNETFYELKERNLWELLINGEINQYLLKANLNKNNYILQREKIGKVINDIENDKLKIGIVHSNLGNGKSLFLKILGAKLSEAFKVFEFNSYKENWELEVERIASINGKKVVIIDNYQNNLQLVFKLLEITDDSCKLILAARSFVNNTIYYRIVNKLKNDEKKIIEYDINLLTSNEITELCYYLEKRKFTEIFTEDIRIIRNIIIRKCNRRLADVLLHIINSSAISRRLDENIDPIINDPNKKNILLAIIISNTCPLDLEFNDIVTLLGNYREISFIEKDASFSEFVDISNNSIKMKSAVLSNYILTSKNLNNEIIELMQTLIKNADRLSEQNRKKIREKLISVSTIRELLVQNERDDKKEIDERILSYFEQLTDFNEFKYNNFFWLQYAMAAIDAKEFERSAVYFENSYKLAKQKSKFNTYQIDTQFGRFLLEKGLNNFDQVNSYNNLEKAISHWIGAINKNRSQSHYVFKQVYLLVPYVERYVDKWSAVQKNNVIKMCNELKSKISYERIDRELKVKQILNNVSELVLMSAVTN